jgi:hypothetical protein
MPGFRVVFHGVETVRARWYETVIHAYKDTAAAGADRRDKWAEQNPDALVV